MKMKKVNLNKKYWEKRYNNDEANWNAGIITPPLKSYIDQLRNKKIDILVLGTGHGHELHYLFQQGFKNITGIDFTNQAALQTAKEVLDFPLDKIVLGDFFEHVGEYDLILEQTFFCSLPRGKRREYAEKIHGLLKKGGKLAGVLFDCEFDGEEPPYGGNKEEYEKLFSASMTIKVLETAYNSIKPRSGRELFVIIEK